MNVNDKNQAFIHPDAKIGKNVSIGPFSYIDKNVEIGDDTIVGPNVTILEYTKIGKGCKISSGAVLGGLPQDLKFEGEITSVEIGDNTIIREFVTINRATKYAWTTKVGSDCLIMAYVHIAHDCILGNNIVLANNVNLAGHVIIDDFAILEGLVAVQQFTKIGTHSFIAGGSLVRKNVPPYVKAAREPLSYAGVNSIGLRRRGFTVESIHNIQDVYRILYVKNNNTTQALNIIEDTLDDSLEKNQIIDFIQDVNKEIMKGFKRQGIEYKN